jgi:protein SCO1/2
LPLNVSFADATGNQVELGSHFHKRPIAMALVYFKRLGLCPMVLHGMASALGRVGFVAGFE